MRYLKNSEKNKLINFKIDISFKIVTLIIKDVYLIKTLKIKSQTSVDF